MQKMASYTNRVDGTTRWLIRHFGGWSHLGKAGTSSTQQCRLVNMWSFPGGYSIPGMVNHHLRESQSRLFGIHIYIADVSTSNLTNISRQMKEREGHVGKKMTLPETIKDSPWKSIGWKSINFLLGWLPCRCELLVSGSVMENRHCNTTK